MPDDTKTDALIPAMPAAPAVNSPEALSSLFGMTAVGAYCSFDPKTPAGRRMSDKCSESPDAKVMAMANVPFRLEHVYAHNAETIDDATGELKPILRICLIHADGTVWACAADGIRSSIVRLVQQHGLPPWKGGIPVVMQLKQTRKGRNWPVLVNHEPAVPPKVAK